MLEVRNREYFFEVIRFAKKTSQWGQLRRELRILSHRFFGVGGKNIKVDLYPDRPMGFGFVLYVKKNEEWKHALTGGLLYHGSHDGFGSGSGPTFAVTLTPTKGWSVHT